MPGPQLTKKVNNETKTRPESSDDLSVEEGLLDEHSDEEEATAGASIPLSDIPGSKIPAR